MSLSLVAIVVAGLSFLVAAASLAWQVASFRLSGVRARVTITRGILIAEPMIHVVSVHTSNVGRQPFSATSCSLYFPSTDERMVMVQHVPGNPALPATLMPGHSISMHFPLADIERYVAGRGRESMAARAEVALGTGETAASDDTIDLPWNKR